MFESRTFKIFDFFLGIPIIHDILFGVYRKQIVQKAEKMGLAWTEFMDEQWYVNICIFIFIFIFIPLHIWIHSLVYLYLFLYIRIYKWIELG